MKKRVEVTAGEVSRLRAADTTPPGEQGEARIRVEGGTEEEQTKEQEQEEADEEVMEDKMKGRRTTVHLLDLSSFHTSMLLT